MPDGEGGFLFSLSTNVTPAEETTARLTLLLDVPCVAPARDGFGAMVACAKALVRAWTPPSSTITTSRCPMPR
jgi:hypothetical protein